MSKAESEAYILLCCDRCRKEFPFGKTYVARRMQSRLQILCSHCISVTEEGEAEEAKEAK